ncbi:efflux RND transporter periplasmic adaptor subunit, partial [Thioclava sp. BHET1]
YQLNYLTGISLTAARRAQIEGVRVADDQRGQGIGPRLMADAEARARELTRRGVESSATAEAAANTLSAARAKLEQARAQLSQARETRGFATMKAPRDGVITTVYVQPGAALTAGQKVLHLAGTDEREAVIDLSDQDVAGLAPGAVFRLRLEAATEIETRATLRVIDPVSDSATRTRRLHLTLAGDAPAAFRLGALVLVEPIDATAARVTLPVTAVLEGADGPHVWVVDPAGRHIHRVAVTTGAVTGDRILVTGGLKPGDEVVTRGIHSLKDGQQVGPRVPA